MRGRVILGVILAAMVVVSACITAEEKRPVEVHVARNSTSVEFTLKVDGDSMTYILPGDRGNFSEYPEGFLLYAFEPMKGRSLYLFTDRTGRKLWERTFENITRVVGYSNGSLILAEEPLERSEETRVYVIRLPSGKEREYPIRERAFHVSNALTVGGKAYVAGASLFSGDAVVYVLDEDTSRRVFIDSMGDRLVGARLIMDSDGRKLAVAYSLDSWSGEYQGGICVFGLSGMDVKARFDLPPGVLREIKVDGNQLTVKTDGETRTYILN
ncbi:hypothetical protein [Thermococcus sp. 21S7]|uniref:hypothetical protein n=1 Tax=Thermococcus sp. 21S7 TaxID=1638221 RepID=UPI00143B715B|nr:hypothetical protein [Thermococcus sp. 21S7]NJE60680.1 hypothetical protein [Thermococcus sp. 21S7]